MSFESGRLAPTLIDTVNGVRGVDYLIDGIHHHVSLFLIAVGTDSNMHIFVLLWSDAENRCMAAARHLQLQMFIRQTNSIIVGMGNLLIMAETRGRFLC